MLTLSNGDRIRLVKNVSLFFEVENLIGATPSIISRAGMMYFDGDILGYMMHYDSWLLTIKDEKIKKALEEFGGKYLQKNIQLQCNPLQANCLTASAQYNEIVLRPTPIANIQ